MSLTVSSVPQQRPLEVTQQVPSTQRQMCLVPQRLNALSAYEVLLTLPPCFSDTLPPLLPSGCTFLFVLAFVHGTAAVVISATVPTRSRKFWSKTGDFNSGQDGIFKSGNFTYRPPARSVQAASLVFDPGGLQLVVVPHKDFASANGRHAAPHELSRCHLRLLCFRNNLSIFGAGSPDYCDYSIRSSTEDADGPDFDPSGGLRPALALCLVLP